MIQAALLAAVHAQLHPAATLTVPVVAAAESERVDGEIEYAQLAGCVTVKVLSAMLSVAVRGASVSLDAIAYPILALPLPLDAVETDSQSTSLLANHSHAAAMVSEIVAVLADAVANALLVGESE